MPKSKKNKIVHLTQVKKKGKDHKEDLMKQLETYVKQYDFLYLFDFDSTKSDRIMNLRLKMKQHGAIFAGRNSLVSLTLKNVGSKTRTNYNKFLKHITGHRGLFFTNLQSEKLIAMLEAGQQEFLDKLLGYAPLKRIETGNSAAGSDSDHDDADEGDVARGKGGERKKKTMTIIRFMPIKKPTKTREHERDADGDVILADANQEAENDED